LENQFLSQILKLFPYLPIKVHVFSTKKSLGKRPRDLPISSPKDPPPRKDPGPDWAGFLASPNLQPPSHPIKAVA